MPRSVRVLSRLLCLSLIGGTGVAMTSAPAGASETLLCEGYSSCLHAGMGNGGYRRVSSHSYWRMYAGHNCTNYAAYRMVRAGLPNTRPWTGGGNATHWGVEESRITDLRPRVGSIAWWPANVGPAGSAGHVAYVERASATVIVVSQDSYGGDFSWARIRRSSTSWPRGFVHFHDVPLVNTAVPTVTGRLRVGSRLVATAGSWRPAAGAVRYRWQADGVDLRGAIGAGFRLTRAQLGTRITVRATASRSGYPTARATSAATAEVAAQNLRNTVAPTITGQPRVGSEVTATAGSWRPAATAVHYQWSADSRAIAGATGARLRIGAAQVGTRLSVTVTASRRTYRDIAATSATTARVGTGTNRVLTPPRVRGLVRTGRVLRVDPGRYTARGVRVVVHWRRNGAAVPGHNRTHRLNRSDIGTRLSAVLTVSAPGYRALTTRTERTRTVRSVPHVRTRLHSYPGRVRVTTSVSARGVRTVGGRVRVLWRGRTLAVVTLHGGTASTVVRGLPRGTRHLHIRYSGSPRVVGRTVDRYVHTR